MSDFYITLPSNSSMNYYPNNTLSHYTTKLPKRVTLAGDWEVGLVEVQYPHTWFNVSEGDRTFRISQRDDSNDKKVWLEVGTFKLEVGYYPSPQYLVKLINGRIKAIFKSDPVSFSYRSITQKIKVTLANDTQITIPSQLKDMFHLKNATMLPDVNPTETTYKSEKPIDLDKGMYALYVYSDIVEPQIVGDSLVSLLRAVPISGEYGAKVYTHFNNAQYHPLARRDFDTVEVDIRDDTGKPIPFERGKLLVTLHLRQRRQLL